MTFGMAEQQVETLIGIDREATRQRCLREHNKAGGILLNDSWVKFGVVTSEEVSNQIEAYRLLDSRRVGGKICRIPKIYDYYSIEGIDYLVMEFAGGGIIESENEALEAVIDALSLIHASSSNIPGPANGGACSGLLFDDQSPPPFESKRALQDYINERLENPAFIDLSTDDLVFTHGDIALRNLQMSTHYLWILDWAYAGYLPRSAELAALQMQNITAPADKQFTERVERRMLHHGLLTDRELRQADCLRQFAFRNIAFHWREKKAKRSRRELRRVKEQSTFDIIALLNNV